MDNEVKNQGFKKGVMPNNSTNYLNGIFKIFVISLISVSIPWWLFLLIDRIDFYAGWFYEIIILPILLIIFSIIAIIISLKKVKTFNKPINILLLISFNLILTVLYWILMVYLSFL